MQNNKQTKGSNQYYSITTLLISPHTRELSGGVPSFHSILSYFLKGKCTLAEAFVIEAIYLLNYATTDVPDCLQQLWKEL